MCAKANLSTAFLPDFVNKLQLKLQCGLKFKKLLKSDLIFYNYSGERLPQQAEISYEGTTATVSLENP